MDVVAASLDQVVATWQGTWPSVQSLVVLAASQPAFTSAAVTAVRSLAGEVSLRDITRRLLASKVVERMRSLQILLIDTPV